MSSGFSASVDDVSQIIEMAAFDNIQAELDKIQQQGVQQQQQQQQQQLNMAGNAQLKTLVVSNASGGFVQGTSLLTNSQTNLVLASAAGQQPQQQGLKRASTGQPGPTMAKVIIRNTGTGKQQIVPISSGALQAGAGNTIFVSALNQSQSPTKTITLSSSSLGSPTRIITAPSTPTKQIVPLSKLPLSPLKSPPKITMIPVSLGKSPQHRAAGGQMVTMLSRGPATSVSSADSKHTAITMSPSKLVIKGQSISMPMQQVSGTNPGGATSIVAQRAQGHGAQPVSVSGSKFQYVRLVTAPASSQQSTVTKQAIQPAPAVRSIMPMNTTGGNMKIAMPPLHQGQQVKVGSQRVILPATSQVSIQPSRPQGNLTQIRPAPINSQLQQIGGTTSINLQNLQNMQGFALVPTNQLQYVTQVQSQPQTQTVKQESFVPISTSGPPPPQIQRHNINGSATVTSDPPGQRPRKPCNCTKSQCLKLYCDCFANGEFCSNCNCNNCANNLDHEDERSRAIKACLERNPMAFHPKIGKGKGRGDGDRRHNKGCNCKRSGCLKNYCECYEAKIMCSNLCKCVGCKNFEESPDRKTLMHLADAAEVRVQQQTAAKSKLSSQIAELPPRQAAPTGGERLPYTFVTKDVAEATCACLVAQAEEAERTRQIEMVYERMILEEFGRCLMQVIESANRTKAQSPVP